MPPAIGTIPRLRLLLRAAAEAEAEGIDIATRITQAEAEVAEGTDITTTRGGIIAARAAAVGIATGAAPRRRGAEEADPNPGPEDPHSPRP